VSDDEEVRVVETPPLQPQAAIDLTGEEDVGELPDALPQPSGVKQEHFS